MDGRKDLRMKCMEEWMAEWATEPTGSLDARVDKWTDPEQMAVNANKLIDDHMNDFARYPCVSHASPRHGIERSPTQRSLWMLLLHRGTGVTVEACTHCIVLYEVRLVLLEGGLSTQPGWTDMWMHVPGCGWRGRWMHFIQASGLFRSSCVIRSSCVNGNRNADMFGCTYRLVDYCPEIGCILKSDS